MKKFEFEISRYALDSFFPRERVKTKIQILEILLEATRYMLSNPKISKKNATGKLVLFVDKMSRLFFFNDSKYFSIAFPFFALEEKELKFSYNNEIDIDSELISNILSVIKGSPFKSISCLDFADSIDELEGSCHENFWVFLKTLLLNEDGYIRYDKDIVGFNEAKEKGYEHRHPIHHFDVCYSNAVTYKIGLDKHLTDNDFIDLLDIKSDCRYLR